MRSDGVVAASPGFEDDLGFGQAAEDLTIQRFVHAT
jgi:hypothetical protein